MENNKENITGQIKENMKEKTYKARKGIKKICTLVGGITLIVIAAVILVNVFSNKKPVIEVTEVKHKLEEIGEFAVSKYTYNDYVETESYRKFITWNIPFMKNYTKYEYSGVIKAGYKVSDMDVDVRNHSIVITLPEVQVLDNYIEKSQLVDSKNSLFNPLDGDEFQEITEDEKERQLQNAVNEGLYTKAKENATKLIEELFSDFTDDYDIVVM